MRRKFTYRLSWRGIIEYYWLYQYSQVSWRFFVVYYCELIGQTTAVFYSIECLTFNFQLWTVRRLDKIILKIFSLSLTELTNFEKMFLARDLHDNHLCQSSTFVFRLRLGLTEIFHAHVLCNFKFAKSRKVSSLSCFTCKCENCFNFRCESNQRESFRHGRDTKRK